jgi:uncharacterized protein (TIGR00251 family)
MKNERIFKIHDGKVGAAITVRVTPRMAKNEIGEILEDGTIKIRLTAAPVDGKANECLINYLADVLETKPSKIEIVSGLTGRNKLVSILDQSPEEVQQKIMKQIAQ